MNQDDNFPAQQIDMVNQQLVATQQQLEQLQTRYSELANGHIVLLQNVVQLQKLVRNHDGAMQRVMGFLHNLDAQRRNSRVGGFANGHGIGISDLIGNGPDDHPASPLQQASQLLGEFDTNTLFSKELEQMQNGLQHRSEYSTPSADHGSASIARTPTSAVADNMNYNFDLDNMVYPVGQINGIDPINSEHINNIPYSFPPSGSLPTQVLEVVKGEGGERKLPKGFVDPGWGPHKPRILLVEDDKTCARVGCKFLQSFMCSVDIARHGLEAVNKMNAGPTNYDLILMDIIMPHLDGISATVCIREIAPTIPVIAMTSNIRADDIEMYFKYGMNDVLPKPFTKEGMLRSLEKHLQQFKRGYVPPPQQGQLQRQLPSQMQQQNAYPVGYQQGGMGSAMSSGSIGGPGMTQTTMTQAQAQQQAMSQGGMSSGTAAMSGPPSANGSMGGSQPPAHMNIAHIANSRSQPIKDENSPGKGGSPGSWHSPGQGQSPKNPGPSGGDPRMKSQDPRGDPRMQDPRMSQDARMSQDPRAQMGGQDPRMAQGGYMPQSGAAYSMTPNNPVPVYQQGAQAASVMPAPSQMQREMAQAQAQQQQAMAGGHRRATSDMDGGQEAKRQRMNYGRGPGQQGGPGYS